LAIAAAWTGRQEAAILVALATSITLVFTVDLSSYTSPFHPEFELVFAFLDQTLAFFSVRAKTWCAIINAHSLSGDGSEDHCQQGKKNRAGDSHFFEF
jgi:hypothetical protein